MRPLITSPFTVEMATVAIRDLPRSLAGCRIVQLSDFHYDGERLATPLLAAVIAQANALKPDLVALTGDYVTTDPSPIFRLIPYLQQLQSRYGTVVVLGNHDNISCGGRQTILQALRQAGIQALWNQVAYPLGPGLPVVGLADFWSTEFDPTGVMASISDAVPRLVLSHNPDSAAELTSYRVDLQLSGHTHGGQIVLPGLGPVPALTQALKQSTWAKLPFVSQPCLKVLHHWDWVSGLYQVGDNQLYVNRGLGTYAPGRFRCPPEVTLVRLIGAEGLSGG